MTTGTKPWILPSLLSLALFLLTLPLDAKPKVVIRTTPSDVGGGEGDEYIYPFDLVLDLDANPTWITVDCEGQTQVYVNNDGNDFSRDEQYRVELPEGASWSLVTIYGYEADPESYSEQGYEQPPLCDVRIRMDGGMVGDIYLNDNSYTRHTQFDATGGTFRSLNLSSSGGFTVNLTGVHDCGRVSVPRVHNPQDRTLLVGLDCTFTNPEFAPTYSLRTYLSGILVPYDMPLMGKGGIGVAGTITIPEFMTLNTPFVTSSGCDIQNLGTINLLTCNGLAYFSGSLSGNAMNPWPHTWGDASVITAPTILTMGLHHCTCQVCGYEEDVPCPALGDLNQDHDVNLEDIMSMAAMVLMGDGCDLNSDNNCNIVDLVILIDAIRGK